MGGRLSGVMLQEDRFTSALTGGSSLRSDAS